MTRPQIARSQAHVKYLQVLGDQCDREGRSHGFRELRERYIRDRAFDRRRGRARAKRAKARGRQ